MTACLRAEAFAELAPLLERLAAFGAEERGGVTRLLYAQPWLDAQTFLAKRMRAAGLEARFDRVGNLYGRLPGSLPEAPIVLTGSHIDTVRSGGRYDGAYGVAAGLLALEGLKRTRGTPLRTLEVVSLCEEEGSRFPLAYWGSGHIAGVYRLEDGAGAVDSDGVPLAEAMAAAGFGRSEQPDCRRSDLGAYVELHIEQGIVLERTGHRLGLVEAIAGQKRFALTVTGASDHAGTTPMALRTDALAGVAEMAVALEARALAAGDPLVATVGRLEVRPNTPNVIPGEVRFTLDVRHHRDEKLERFCREALELFAAIASRRGLTLDAQAWLETEPAPMHSGLTALLDRICCGMNLPPLRMVSGAGHDAQLFATLCPTAMLFVPSKGGVSHSPEEYTSPENLADGAVALADCLYELAYREEWPL
ncbi:Zn-dependent hydrolase [Cohnella sp. REN36]|uniref:Zn-dependent hydrolase n=1 Tax=Cohnella sp. REN36 TaxID=2887347 RepID=UPI001D14887C|nr:Zn-dependent hydrolase [Cohnella sp. REN36]MCC3372686.1 Zn-dependent hydrolase [Cohnella sp. REN36]